jgi:hypothetical protein
MTKWSEEIPLAKPGRSKTAPTTSKPMRVVNKTEPKNTD